jgi:hypothetical protein
MLNVLLKDCLQASIIGLLWWYSIEPSEKLSQHKELLQLADTLLGGIGVFLIESLWASIPFFLCGLVKNIFRRIEILAQARSQLSEQIS